MFCKNSKWIGCGGQFSSPVVIKRFCLEEFSKAIIDICGLGYYELFINGQRVGEEYFKPVVSDYAERDFSDFLYPLQDKTSHSIYYNTHKVTELLHKGENVIAVILGNGFYRQTKRIAEGNTKFGDELILRFDLKVDSPKGPQNICTDGTEEVAESFIKENNLFYGEVHDYKDFSLSDIVGTEKVHLISPPKAKLKKQKCKNDAVREKITPVIVRKTENSTIFDAGKNLSGFVCLKAKSDLVRVRHAENLKADGLDFESAGGDEQISENIYKNAEGLTVHPWFSWSGFRYFEVFGEAEDVEVFFITSDVKLKAEFECGNGNINWFFKTYIHTQLCNMHGGVPSDCPQRERLGYTGDGQLSAESAMLLTDSRSFYEKWIADIADCQDINSGHIQHTAPFFGGGGGPGGWGCAMVVVPYAYYRVYGDKEILKKYFGNMLRFIESMKGFSENGLIVREREKGWCLGDWCPPGDVLLPEAYVNTYYYIRSMETVEEIAGLIGEKVDYTKEISESRKAMVDSFFDSGSCDFCGGVQGANAFALLLGLGNAATKENLLKHYKETKVFDTGIFGTDVLMEYLVKAGEAELIFELLSTDEYPSFGYMKKMGATTVWEKWNGEASHNHPMFGACARQLFYGFLGLKANAGFENIALDPPYIEDMGYMNVKLKLPKGTLKAELKYTDGKVHSNISATGSLKVRLK